MLNDFKNFIAYSFDDLQENALFANQAERDALVKDKSRVAAALMFNFFGMLGMINATKPAQKRTVLSYLQKDKKLRIDTIDDTNHDISLSVKLAHEAGFFMSDNVVGEITRFLVKLKAGQIDHIDSIIVAKWANSMKPDFALSLANPKMKAAFNEFKTDGGKTIDVSRLAVVLKSVVNKVGDGGDFKGFAKRFFGLAEISPSTTTPTAPAIPVAAVAAQPVVPGKLSYYQRQKLKKQAAAQAAGATTAAAAPAAPAAPKLSYYQRQKLVKDAAKQAEAERIAAEKAAAELKAKEEEENRRAKAAALKSMPKADFDKLMSPIGDGGRFSSYPYGLVEPYLKRAFGFDIVPDIYTFVAENLEEVSSIMYDTSTTYVYSDVVSHVRKVRQLLAAIQSKTGHEVTVEDLVRKVFGGTSTNIGSVGGRYVGALLANSTPFTVELYKDTIAKLNADGVRALAQVLVQAGPSVTNDVIDVMMQNHQFVDQMMANRGPVSQVFELSRAWGSNAPKYTYSSSYAGLTEFGVNIIKRMKKPLSDVIDMVMSHYEYAYQYIAAACVAYGLDNAEITGLDNQYVNVMRPLFEDFLKGDFKYAYGDIKKRIFVNEYAHLAYNPSSSSKGGLLMIALHNEFAKDLIENGWGKSKLSRLTDLKMSNYTVKYIIKGIGVDVDELTNKHPNDPASIYFKAIKDGLSTVDSNKLAEVILSEAGQNARVDDIVRMGNVFVNEAFGDRDANSDAIAQSLLVIAKTRPNDFANKSVGESMLKFLPYATQDTTIAWLKHARDTGNGWIMGPELYKSLHKRYKQDYVDTLTGIVQDCIGSDVEDYVNDIMEDLAPHVVQKMRGNLVGATVLIDEINKGDIKPFDKIDASRLKKIFLYNDINMSSILTGVVDKKKKSETYTQYFNRAKSAVSGNGILQRPKVKADDAADAKAINQIMIRRDHAGKHGDTYPKIDKVFDANVEYPEFWEFRKKKPKDGSIVPAYHGTGGIAASMILRYGFKVIKSSDPSVVGRMLGDGIYFSNKIDKVSQYVSNGGYSRKHGQKGYILELDTNLGTKNVDYRAAGVSGGDKIRSPEWCVSDPKAQLRIIKAYEVELVSKATVDRHLNESVRSVGIMGFKQYLKEQDMLNIKNVTSFVFRDGMIPIVDQESSDVSYVDFEVALAKKLIDRSMFDITGQGPAIVFRDTPEQALIDERFASHMGGDDLQLYIRLFRNKMFGG